MPDNKVLKDYNLPAILADLDRWTVRYRGYVNQIVTMETTLEKKVNQLFWVVRQVLESQVDVTENFKLLYEFVRDYFENLDVQEEINNKLNDMAKDGTLATIIASVIGNQQPIIVESTSQMTDPTRLYVLAETGHLWQWNGTAFVDTGLVYNNLQNVVSTNGVTITPANIVDAYRDLNSIGVPPLVNNKVYRYSGFTNAGEVQNVPVDPFNGNIILLSNAASSNYGPQIAVTEDGRMFFRYLNPGVPNTFPWKPLFSATQDSDFLESLKTNITPSTITADQNNFNNIGSNGMLNNHVYRYASFTSANIGMVANAPTDPFNGILFQYAPMKSSNYGIQIAISEDSTGPGKMYYRYLNPGNQATWRWEIAGNAINAWEPTIQPSNITTPFTDLDNIGRVIGNNYVYRYASFTEPGVVANVPEDPFNGVILAYGINKTQNYGPQIAITETGNMYYRFLLRSGWYKINDSGSGETGIIYEVSTAEELFNTLNTVTGKATINMAPGVYDLYEGLYEDFILTDRTDVKYLNGNITINGNGSTINLHVPLDVATAHRASANEVAIINNRNSITVNNLYMSATNCRYTVHDESLANESNHNSVHNYNNCVIEYDCDATSISLNANAIGIGGSLGQAYNFTGCVINQKNTTKTAIYIHGRDYSIGSLNIDKCNIYCNDAVGAILLSQYTGNDLPTYVQITNSYIGAIMVMNQTGSTQRSQWRLMVINSYITRVYVAPDITVLYEPIFINTISGTRSNTP